MRIEITHIHFPGYERTHSAIASYKWRVTSTGETGTSDKATMVDWLNKKDNSAYVGSSGREVEVGVWEGTPPYLRTYADGEWSNNLLSLPTF